MSEPLRVVAAVFRAGNQILACKRKPEKAAGGKWEFPGGKIEPGESAEYALRREILEELGIDIDGVGELVSRDTTANTGATIDLACYWVDTEVLPESSTDHDELLWCTIEELSSLNWAIADLPTVRRIQQIGISTDSMSEKEV